jgi:hypothetical protein
MSTHDPLREATEIREQLASDKRRLGFFFGAGTSMAVGLPGIIQLTKNVEEKIITEHKNPLKRIKKSFLKKQM